MTISTLNDVSATAILLRAAWERGAEKLQDHFNENIVVSREKFLLTKKSRIDAVDTCLEIMERTIIKGSLNTKELIHRSVSEVCDALEKVRTAFLFLINGKIKSWKSATDNFLHFMNLLEGKFNVACTYYKYNFISED